MDVLKVILDWSYSRPEWQRDALRRIITKGNLDESDFEELVTICKATHGLDERQRVVPLDKSHIPDRGAGSDVVNLSNLTHHGGVNALAKGQTIQFGPGLTVIYGDNASGKSGYSRILKSACRARGSEDILGNVLGESALGRPSATISFSAGGKEDEAHWNDQEATHEALSHVSVFDARCAAVYLREKTDVAFRPFGLDVFDKLSDACEEVRKSLERERRELDVRPVPLPTMPEGSVAQRMISKITSLTDPEAVRRLSKVTGVEKGRLKQVRKRLQDLQGEDPKKTARSLTLQAQRLESLSSHLIQLEGALSDESIRSLFEARDLIAKKTREATEMQNATFPPDLLNDTGSELWRQLWESARKFSTEQAYQANEFPVIDSDSRCVLCQQGLGKEATERMKRFEEYVQSTVQQELDRERTKYGEKLSALEELILRNGSIEKATEELRLESDELVKSVEKSLLQGQLLRDQALKALREGQPFPELPVFESHAMQVAAEVNLLHDRAKQVLDNKDREQKDELIHEQTELEARGKLDENLESVIREIERKKKLAAYRECLQEAGTTAITRKSSEVTKRVVTKQLAASFQDELRSLHFSHLEVELQPAGGTRGALYHNLVLKRAPGVHPQSIVSEGEARSLSIASFFAELSTAIDKSAIIFDDPVSSLDHKWREYVAGRLVKEAHVRQIVVFTHDIVFLLTLKTTAAELGVQCDHQYLHRHHAEIGLCSPEIPWVAMKVKDRIGALKDNCQKVEKLHRTATKEEYERDAIHIYGHLRETWERGLEEVLLNEVVQRYRPDIQTLRAKKLFDITEEDCRILDAGVTKCSRWLPGHDLAPAENVPVPEPDELKRDIEQLEEWVKTIKKRRR